MLKSCVCSFERCTVSATAKEKIEKAGGTISTEEKAKPHKVRVPKEAKPKAEKPAKKGKK